MSNRTRLRDFFLGSMFLVASAALLAFSWGTFSDLFSSYQGNPSATYIALGGLLLALALGTGAFGIAVLRVALKGERVSSK